MKINSSARFNEPRQPNVAHDKFVECSNKGSCNYNTGECDCQKGYEVCVCVNVYMLYVVIARVSV